MRVDVVAEDAQGRAVLFVAVRAKAFDDETARLVVRSMREAAPPSVRFGMAVDLCRIRIADFEREGDDLVRVLDTTEILREYDPDVGTKRIFGHYLTTLVEGWLRDLAFHWKLEAPPGLDQMREIGLARCLENGDTRSEVLVGPDPLR